MKNKVVISLKAENGYSAYYFSSMSFFTAPLPITYSTLGVVHNKANSSKIVDNGSAQDLSHMSYFYRPYGLTPVCTEIDKLTLPAPTPHGAASCDPEFGSVKTYVDGVLKDPLACFGSFQGNNDHNLCTENKEDKICLNYVLNTQNDIWNIDFCPLEKINIVDGQFIYDGNNGTLTVDPEGKSGTFLITNESLSFPLIITLKASNSFSAYIINQGYNGTWSTKLHALSHATLWGSCPPAAG